MNQKEFTTRSKFVLILIAAALSLITAPLACPAAQQVEEPGGALMAGTVWDRHHSDHADWASRTSPGLIAFDGKMWILGGLADDASGGEYLANDVWQSSDGKNWTEISSNAPWQGRTNHGAIVYDGKMWILGGKVGPDPNPIFSNDVWYSTDGLNWVLATASAPWSPRQARSCAVFDANNDGTDEILVIGGNAQPESNEVWSSTDGVNWTLLTAAAPWTARKQFTSVVFDGDGDGQNEIWIIGGVTTGANHSDVWRSNDGVNWTLVTDSAPWGGRRRHSSVVFDGRMWVIGGYSDGSQHDVWWSFDGQSWTQASDDGHWDSRVVHASIVFNDGLYNRMWIVGGRGPNGKFQDVWHDMRDVELDVLQHVSGDTPVTIRSPNRTGRVRTVSSSISVDDQLSIADLNVNLDITHSNDGDLVVFLIHNFVDVNGAPQETRVELFSGVGGSGDNFSNTTFDDDVNRDEFIDEPYRIADFSAPFTGSFAGEGWLRDFDGQNANGTWTLEITDTAKYNDGTLNNWSLDFYGTSMTPPPGGGSETYSSLDTPLNVPDNDPGGVSSDVLAGDHEITDLTVTLDISHPRPSDLEVQLTGPDNTTIQLFNFFGDNNVPNFNGTNSVGFWTLNVIDNRRRKSGTLNSWSITIETP